MVNIMICKICGKNINGCSLVCNKCRNKKIKSTSIPNGIEYIDKHLRASNNSNQDKYNNCVSDMIMVSKKTKKEDFPTVTSSNKEHPIIKKIDRLFLSKKK